MTEAQADQQTQNHEAEARIPSQGIDTPNLSGASVGNTTPAIHESKSVRSTTETHIAPAAVLEEVHGLSWINQQPPGNYTLQMMAAVSPKPLLAFTRKASLTGPLAIAGVMKDEKVLHLLLQGSYATLGDAERASVQIEQEAGVRPWVRRFSSLPELFESNRPPAPVKHEAVKLPPPPLMGAAWVWSRNPVHYTIQLMGDRRVDSIRAFVDKQRPASPLAVVRVRHQGKPWYLLVSGDYPSEEETVAAINLLPKEMTGGGPWSRRFASLQDQMVAGNH